VIKKVLILETPGCSSCARASAFIKKLKEEEKLTFAIEEVNMAEHPE